MPIIKRLNPKANPNNALQLTAVANLCCGDDTDLTVVDYTATIPVASDGTTRITLIRFGGVSYTLNGSYDPTQAREVTALKADIERVIRELGYATDGCVDVYRSSTNLIVALKESALVANYVNTSGTAFATANSKTIKIPA